ncbi:DUF4019 domain-containing protein [Salinisphaera aquimarina]
MMKMTLRTFLLLLLCAGCSSVQAAEPSAPNPNGGQKISVKGEPVTPLELERVLTTVNTFLAALRSGQNAPGYDLLSPDSKKTESETQWNELFDQMHDKTGKRLSSTFGFALRTDTLPNAPKSDYVVVGLKSSFEKARLAETIILTKVDDRYLISGYHFQSTDASKQP